MTDPQPQFPGFRLGETVRTTRAGVWFRARQVRIGRDVLLKVPDTGDLRALNVLRHEVELLGKHRHAGLITLFDFHSDWETPYAVYEFPGERPLDRVVAEWQRGFEEGEPFVEKSLGAAIQIAELFAFLNGNGVCVRHASPQDFCVDGAGRVRLTSLEAASPSSLPDVEGPATWSAPPHSGVDGDLFLLGLYLVYLFSGKVLTWTTVRQNPSQVLEKLEPSLRRQFGRTARKTSASVGAGDVMHLLRSLLTSKRPTKGLHATQVVESLRAIQTGEPLVKVESNRHFGMYAGFAFCLLLGVVIGVSMWQGSDSPKGREQGDDGGAPVGVQPVAQSQAPAAPTPEMNLAVEPPEAIDDPEESKESVVAEAEPRASEPDRPSDGSGAVGPVDVDLPADDGALGVENSAAPDVDDAQEVVPEAVTLFLHRWESHLSNTPLPERAQTELWYEGLETARMVFRPEVPIEPKSSLGRFATALIELGTELEYESLRRRLFSTDSVEWEGKHFKVVYDFASRHQLRDWEPVGSSRCSLSQERLVIHGTVLLRPSSVALWLRGEFRMNWKVLAEGGREARLNNNLLVALASESQAEGDEKPYGKAFLFGNGTDLGTGSSAPTNVVLRLAGMGPTDVASLAPWTSLWIDASRSGRGPNTGTSSSDFRWSSETSWRVNGRALADSKLELPELAGRRFVVGFFSAQSMLEIEEIQLEGTIDTRSLRLEARRSCVRQLSAETEGLQRLLSLSDFVPKMDR